MLVALGALFLAPMGAIADERAPSSQRWTVSLDVAATGMAEVRQPFRIDVTPIPKAEGGDDASTRPRAESRTAR